MAKTTVEEDQQVKATQLSMQVVNYHKQHGRAPTGAEMRALEMVVIGIPPAVRVAMSAELAGDIDTLAKCSARVMTEAHTSLKHLEEATGLPLLSGEVVLNKRVEKEIDIAVREYVNREVEDEEEQLEFLTRRVDDHLFLLGLRHLKPRLWLDGDQLKIEILIKTD